MSSGKGDTPRPLSVDQETFSNNWDRVFGTPKEDAPEEYTNLLISGMFWELFPGLTGNWVQDKLRWESISDTYKKRLYEK